jgi:hypothetical protein
MAQGEMAYLGMVVIAAVLFGLTLAWASWRSG